MGQVSLQAIQEAINMEQWEVVAQHITNFHKENRKECQTDVFAILEASLYIHMERYKQALSCIHEGFKYNIFNYELYFMLGNIKEVLGNQEQALFSYENAALYAKGEDKSFLEGYLTDFRKRTKGLPGKVAIIIVSYKNLEYTKICVDSIEQQGIHYPGTYEIIVIDNHSEDGTKEWLENSSYKYLINEDNKGFPAACNQGIQLADKDSDIFLLNNDTVVMPNSIYCLRMGLYEETKIGVTGSVSNCVANNQMISEAYDFIEQYIEYCKKNNIYSPERYELRVKLVGFAMMFRRKSLNQVGLLDEAFGLGHYEDDDISVRLLKEGYKVVLCRDSFIFHYGNRSFCKRREEKPEEHHECIVKNKLYFINKHGVDLSYYANIRTDVIEMIREPKEKKLHFLEIGCGCGATLLKLMSEFPNAEVQGVEIMPSAADLTNKIIAIDCQNIENKALRYPTHFFDYIIIADVLECLHEPVEILNYMKGYLREGGCMIISVPNILHHSAIIPLLHGQLDYQDKGILDKTNLRFFTIDSILKLLITNGFEVENVCANMGDTNTEKDKRFIEELLKVCDTIKEETFNVYQYVLKVHLKK